MVIYLFSLDTNYLCIVHILAFSSKLRPCLHSIKTHLILHSNILLHSRSHSSDGSKMYWIAAFLTTMCLFGGDKIREEEIKVKIMTFVPDSDFALVLVTGSS